MAVAIALIRGFARRRSSTIGNYWVDLTRGTLYVLLPICVLAALFLITQGVPQTLGPSIESATLEGVTQTIARGPVASQEAIKVLSGDGGGFFNANSAHPFENPSPLTNFVELVLILVLGAALTNCFGRMIGSERQGWTFSRSWGCCSPSASAPFTRWKHAAILRLLPGRSASQPVIPRSSGTLPTGGALFVWFLLGVIVVAGGLTYLPAMALGPTVEHLRLAIGALN